MNVPTPKQNPGFWRTVFWAVALSSAAAVVVYRIPTDSFYSGFKLALPFLSAFALAVGPKLVESFRNRQREALSLQTELSNEVARLVKENTEERNKHREERKVLEAEVKTEQDLRKQAEKDLQATEEALLEEQRLRKEDQERWFQQRITMVKRFIQMQQATQKTLVQQQAQIDRLQQQINAKAGGA